MLIVAQLVKKFPAFYESRMLITLFIRTELNLILSQMNPVHILKPYSFCITFKINFPSDVMFLKDLFLSGLTKLCVHHSPLPCVLYASLIICSFQTIRPNQRSVSHFVQCWFLKVKISLLSAPPPTPKTRGPSLFDCPQLFIQYICSYTQLYLLMTNHTFMTMT
jgi:hypothetical protein